MAILVSVTDVGESGRTTGGRSGGTGDLWTGSPIGYFQFSKDGIGLRDRPNTGTRLDDWKESDGSDWVSLVMRADRDRHFSFPVRNGFISVFDHFQGTENPEWKLWNEENYYLRVHSLV